MSTDNKHIIRTSDRNLFKQCRQKWDFTSKIRQNWEPKRDAEALTFGTAVHAGLETYYDPKTWDVLSTDANVVVLSHALSAFRESLPAPTEDWDDERRARYEELLELGYGMLKHYFKWAPTVDKFKPVYTEIEFEVPIKESPFNTWGDGFNVDSENNLHFWNKDTASYELVVYQGRIDLIVEDEYGGYWLVDHKTASKFDSVEWLELDDQCGSYGWAIAHQLGIKVQGVIYNELRKDVPHQPKELKSGALSKDKSQNTTYELYLETLWEKGIPQDGYEDILDHFKQQGNKFFRRSIVRRSPKEFEILGKRIAVEAVDMINNPAIYPNVGKFNCNGCQFYAPCLAMQEGSDVEWILKENYVKRES